MASNNTTNDQIYEWKMSFHTPLVVLAFAIIIVNLPAVFLYYKIPSLRHSAGNTFLVGLAIADLLCACVMIPTALVCDLRALDGDHYMNMYQFYWVTNTTVSLASIYHIVAATVAKYFAIIHPMRNITACTKPRVNFIIAVIWIVSFLVGHNGFYFPIMSENQFHTFANFLIGFAFALPTSILTCIHVHIYIRLFLSSRPRALIAENNIRSKSNRRVALLFLVLFLFFIISWLPWYLIFAGYIEEGSKGHDSFTLLRFAAPVINPLIFTFAKQDFRKAALSLVSGIRGRQRQLSSRRSCHTQATSSVDRANFIEQQTFERTSKVEHPEREETTVNETEEMQII